MAAPGAINLATAYVSISASTGGLGKQIQSTFGDKAMGRVGDSAGKSITSRMGGVLKKGAIGVGAAAGGVLATALFKGWNRLTNIENATAKLSGLGHSAATVKGIMDDALKSVKGTAFGLDEAGTVAAGAVASGIKPGKELQRTLTLMGDAATIGGSSLGEMGAIFNKVAASGKIQGDVIAQLGDRGIPILQLLGKEIGKTPAEVSKLASQGKIDFATFQSAMEKGLGGAAQKSGETTAGAFKNAGAAMGRFGATLLKGVFPIAKTVFGGITKLFDAMGDKIGPVVEKVSAALVGFLDLVTKGDYNNVLRKALGIEEDSAIVDKILNIRDATIGFFDLIVKGKYNNILRKSLGLEEDSAIIDRIFNIRDAIKDLWAGVTLKDPASIGAPLEGFVSMGQKARQAAVDLGSKVKPILSTLVDLAEALWPAVRDIAKAFFDASKVLGVSSWQILLVALDLIAVTLKAAVPLVQALAKWIGENEKVVRNAAIGFVIYSTAMKGYAIATGLASVATKGWAIAQKLLNTAMSANPIVKVVTLLVLLGTALVTAYQTSDRFREVVDGAFQAVKSIVGTVVGWVQGFLEKYGGVILAQWNNVWGAVQGTFDSVWKSIQDIVDAIKPWLSAAWDFIVSAAKVAFGLLKSYVEFVFGFLETFWDNWGGALMTFFTNTWDTVKKIFSGALDIIRGVFTVFAGIFTGDWGRVWEGLKGVFQGAWKIVSGAIGQAINVLKLLLETAWATIKTVATTGWNLISGAVSTAWGKVVAKVDETITSVKKTLSGAWTVVQTAVSKAWEGIVTAVSTVWQGLVDAVKAPIIAVMKFVQKNFLDPIQKMFTALDLGVTLPVIWEQSQSGSWRTGGYTGNGGVNEVAGVVHGKEYVINAASTAKIMRENPGYLDGLNGYASGGFVSPVNAPHGRWGRYASGGYHPAYDYPVPTGTPVKAPYDSTIIRDGWDSSGYGIHVRGLSTSGIYWVLGHNSREIVSPGQQVKAGQIVSYSGSTGRSSGPHVHFGTSHSPNMYGPGAFDPGTGRGVGGFLGASNLGADIGMSIQETVSGQAGKIGATVMSGMPSSGGIFGKMMENVIRKLIPGISSKGGNAGRMDQVRGQGGAGIRPELHDLGRGVIMPGTHLISNKTKRPEYLLDEKNLSRIGGGGGDVNFYGPVGARAEDVVRVMDTRKRDAMAMAGLVSAGA